MTARPAILLTTSLCLFATAASAQVRSAIQFYDSTAATQTARIGWQGGEGGRLYIDAPNDGTGPGITSQQGNLTVKGTVTAAGLAGDGAGITGIPQAAVSGLPASLLGKADVSATYSRTVLDARFAPLADTTYVKDRMAPQVVTSAMIRDTTIDSADIKGNAIRTSHIKDAAVTNAKIAANTIDSTRLANGSVTTNEILNSTILEDDLGSTLASKINGKMDQSGGTFTGAVTVNGTSGAEVMTFNAVANWPIVRFMNPAGVGDNRVFFTVNGATNLPSAFFFQNVYRDGKCRLVINGPGSDTPEFQMEHDGTNAVLSTSKGDLHLVPSSGTRVYCSKNFEAYGNISSSNGTCCSSDRRFKRNILPIDSALQKLLRLQGVTFEWQTDQFPERNFTEGRQVGVVAQDMEVVLPEVVTTGTDGYKAVAYDKLTAVLIEAVKQQQAQIEDLTQRLRRIEGDNGR
jgi:hypothetical protein